VPLTATTVVVPIDFSAESPRAIAAALEIVAQPDGLHLVHVMPPLETMSPGFLVGDITEESRTRKVTEALTKLATETGATAAILVALIGTPGLEISDYSRRQQADLIVIPSHGYHGVKRLFLGSVAERVIRHAACNVLVVRRSDAE
jgi:nucleotide-binding universal stress UspA family protein